MISRLKELNKTNKILVTVLLILIFFYLIVIMYQGTVDAFLPKHIGVSYLLTDGGELFSSANALFKQVPIFYSFVAIIIEVMGVDLYSLPILPIMGIPYFIIFYGFIYSFSKKTHITVVLSLLLTFCLMTFPSTGTSYMGLWPHGQGTLLFYSFLILISILFKNARTQVSCLIACILIIIVLPFVSYNADYLLMTVLLCLLVYSCFKPKKLAVKLQKYLLPMFLINIIVLFGLSSFIYDSFIPLVRVSSFSQDPLSLFLAAFWGKSEGSEVTKIALSYPSSILILNIIQYVVFAIIILIGLWAIMKYDKDDRGCAIPNIIIPIYLSVTIAVILWFIIRLYIGGFELPSVFYIVIFSVILITFVPKNVNFFNMPKCTVGLLTIILILNLITNLITQSNDLVEKDDYEYIQITSKWICDNCRINVYYPDELTYSWSYLGYCANINCYGDNVPAPVYLSKDDLVNLYYNRPISSGLIVCLNFREDIVNAYGWTVLLPLKEYEDVVINNSSIRAKIYMLNNDIVIVLT